MNPIILLCLLLPLVTASGWTYDRCASEGPEDWPGTCSKSVQVYGSPINLCGGQAFVGTAPTITLTGYDAQRQLKVFNNGHTLQVDIVDSPPTLAMGNIATIVKYANTSTSPTWALAQMHLHWGRSHLVFEGSEHYMQGKKYPLEAHLVHYNTAYGNSVTTALASGKKDSLLVVGVFFWVGPNDAPLIAAIAGAAATATQTPTILDGKFLMSDVLPTSILGKYYAYPGSLTTPPCTEAVTWVVMQTPLFVTEQTLNTLKAASGSPPATISQKFRLQSGGGGSIAVTGNYRPLQATAGRPIYSTTEYGMALCSEPKEPEFHCSSSASFARPAFVLQLAAVLSLLFNQWH